jgi:carbamoyltransferase
MIILGISCYYHDSAAALLKDGELIAAAEEERFSRNKHDFGFPYKAIEFCLEQAGIQGEDLDYAVFYEKPLLKFERIMLSTLGSFPQSYGVFRESMITWLNEKLWIKSQILTKLNLPEEKLLFVDHHMSHAASALFCSPYDEAALLTIDGVGEWTTATIGKGTAFWPEAGDQAKSNAIELFGEQRFPHSLGLLYSAFTAFLGFRVNNGEYKVMGMAPYGQPTRMEDVYKLIEVADDGSFQLDMRYFDFHHSTKRTYSQRFIDLFGEARVHDVDFYTPDMLPNPAKPHWDQATARINQGYADIAASIQRVTEETIIKMVRHVHERTGSENLCMAGGVALNSVANGRIARETPFTNVFIQPAAGDSGGALGAALYVYHVLLGNPRKFTLEHAYWGKGYTPDQVQSALAGSGYRFEHQPDPEKRAVMMVDDILAGRVISLFQDRFEWGPRALGNRSILADPRQAGMKDTVNATIKYREPFRPFAPVILEEKAADFYDGVGDAASNYPIRYMLMVYQTRENIGQQIQAVTHENGTGRMQTVRREWNPLYYRAIELFGEATGVPVLLNTSFNLRGEPIVNTPENALNTFSKSELAALYIDDYIVRK